MDNGPGARHLTKKRFPYTNILPINLETHGPLEYMRLANHISAFRT